jgi:hypothetical protein
VPVRVVPATKTPVVSLLLMGFSVLRTKSIGDAYVHGLMTHEKASGVRGLSHSDEIFSII